MERDKKGFTLVELLIVIGIIAILSAAVIFTLNPAELLAQSRDAQRIADFDTLRSAITIYLTDVTSPTLGETEYVTSGTACGLGDAVCTTSTDYTVDGGGWVDINFTSITGGSPLATLPRDPTNNANYNYAYDGNNTAKTFELNSRLESTKHRDKMVNDGGDDNTCTGSYVDTTCYYEIGNDPGLNL
ncbi:MAG: type II secretion system protein [Candidatus Colwellbacteria bacterium]|nr:type II secretion system protein [Candidatus Colwellbacteria bacterium]